MHLPSNLSNVGGCRNYTFLTCYIQCAKYKFMVKIQKKSMKSVYGDLPFAYLYSFKLYEVLSLHKWKLNVNEM